MKKTLIFGGILSLALWAAFPVGVFAAGDALPADIISVSPTSATADGNSKITLVVGLYYYYCASNDKYSYDPTTCSDGSAPVKSYRPTLKIAVRVSGSDNTISNTQTADGEVYVTAGADGKAQFTIASTKAESKTVQIWQHGYPIEYGNPVSKAITFTAPATATPKKTTTPVPQASAPAKVEAAPPEAPKTVGLKVNGEAATGSETITIQTTESLILKGTTVANGVVKLFIFSDPKEATVTADAQGNWSYEVSGLEPGDHHVEAEVTDPATNKTSARANLAAFSVQSVAKPAATVKNTKTETNNGWMIWLGIGAAVVLLGSGFAIWWWRKHRNPTILPPQAPSDNSTPPSDTPQA